MLLISIRNQSKFVISNKCVSFGSKLSCKSKTFLELGSQDPPLFAGLCSTIVQTIFKGCRIFIRYFLPRDNTKMSILLQIQGCMVCWEHDPLIQCQMTYNRNVSELFNFKLENYIVKEHNHIC